MADVLKDLPQNDNPNLLVGFNKADDAGIFRISDDQALVQTVDFFPPIVDDPYFFGQIAAANALSDVFAMGGRPVTALNIVGFPLGTLSADILTDILRGGNEKIVEAGAVVVGGHSIKDKELKYGLAVTGLVHPDRIITNSGANVGDQLFLTKPLGTGLITTGIKRDAVGKELIETVIVQMTMLNMTASDIMLANCATAATDVTGFGLLGHAHEMAAASGVSLRLFADRIPLLPQVLDLVDKQMIPGGANDNRLFLADKLSIGDNIDKRMQAVLFDPQTSGGLLIAVPEKHVTQCRRDLAEANLPNVIIGQVEPSGPVSLVIE